MAMYLTQVVYQDEDDNSTSNTLVNTERCRKSNHLTMCTCDPFLLACQSQFNGLITEQKGNS